MTAPLSRRTLLKGLAAASVVPLLPTVADAAPAVAPRAAEPGFIHGKMTGSEALVAALIEEGTDCVFGIPGAQENELWDTMKAKGLAYLLCTHEFSASTMADGAARATGKPGVMCVVPGPGLTNSLTGIGEAYLDSIPMVCIIADVARGDKYKPFQVHELPQVGLAKQVCKEVIEVKHVAEIADAVRRAFYVARCGEPGPVAVVVPCNFLIEADKFDSAPLGMPALPFDEAAFQSALALLSDKKINWGIYVGLGCMDYGPALAELAEILQAPVATSISGKGAISDHHALAVGYGYGGFGTRTAEEMFKGVDAVLAIGVRYSEVGTAFYAIPKHKHLIQVDINPNNLGQIVKPDVCVNADAGLFMDRLNAHREQICRKSDDGLKKRIARLKATERNLNNDVYGKHGCDPLQFILALRRNLCSDSLLYVDVTLAEHLGSIAYTVSQPRTYFNPTDNQAMGWSIPAALGGQRVLPNRQVATVTGDGCFLMSAMEISTAGREGLPVKFFVLDDVAYKYMQTLQKPAYLRTTATILARMDYCALARGFGVGYHEITNNAELDSGIQTALQMDGPVLVRVANDYGDRPIRWVEAAKGRFMEELSHEQRRRFLARIGSRAVHVKERKLND